MSNAREETDVFSRIHRTAPMITPPPPPIHEPIVRLVHTDFGLPALFAQTATAAGIHVDSVYVEELAPRLIDFLRTHNCTRLALPASRFLDQLGIPDALRQGNFTVRLWPEMTVDDLQNSDAAITDVYAAVAETGSLVLRSSPQTHRALGLIPPIHVAILQPRDFLPDLLDLLDKLKREPTPANTLILSGPGKPSPAPAQTASAAAAHGAGLLHVFLLQ